MEGVSSRDEVNFSSPVEEAKYWREKVSKIFIEKYGFKQLVQCIRINYIYPVQLERYFVFKLYVFSLYRRLYN